MKTPTLDEQYLLNLTPDQKAKIWRYYLLVNSPDVKVDEQVQQISELWNQAEEDERLLEWLEFIDYFYSNVEENELPLPERRVYLSEYLAAKVGLSCEEGTTDFPVLLECPNGRGYVMAMVRGQGFCESTAFHQTKCRSCGYDYSKHVRVKPEAIWLDT